MRNSKHKEYHKKVLFKILQVKNNKFLDDYDLIENPFSTINEILPEDQDHIALLIL